MPKKLTDGKETAPDRAERMRKRYHDNCQAARAALVSAIAAIDQMANGMHQALTEENGVETTRKLWQGLEPDDPLCAERAEWQDSLAKLKKLAKEEFGLKFKQ